MKSGPLHPRLVDLGARGLPFYDPNNAGRIWSLRYNSGATNYDAIEYSDDWGYNWTTWKELTNKSNYSTLAMDSNGNFYYAQSTALFKCATDGTESTEITWGVAKEPWSWYNWTWGEDAAGNLYTSAYTLVGTGGQYIWKYNGSSWSQISTLITDYPACRHVHSLHVNPYNDQLYVCWGDDATTRGIGYSTDGGTTVTKITESDTPGPTGLTFTSEGVWFTTDITGGAANKLKSCSDDITAVDRWTVPTFHQQAPLYYCRAIENDTNEIWLVGYNELGVDAANPAIWKLTKATGVASTWSAAKIFEGDDSFVNGASYYAIACGLNGIIPNVPYIFIERIGTKGMYRVERSTPKYNYWQ